MYSKSTKTIKQKHLVPSEEQTMVSLKDIARECGVSTATVSKALNDQRDIGEETKQKVKATA